MSFTQIPQPRASGRLASLLSAHGLHPHRPRHPPRAAAGATARSAARAAAGGGEAGAAQGQTSAEQPGTAGARGISSQATRTESGLEFVFNNAFSGGWVHTASQIHAIFWDSVSRGMVK